MLKSQRSGFTLIELIVFIVVIGIVSAAIFVPLQVTAVKTPEATRQMIATELAQQRMELILGRRYLQGYSVSVLDPCALGSPPTACTPPSGYNVNVNIVNISLGKSITVTVSGLGNATLVANIGNY